MEAPHKNVTGALIEFWPLATPEGKIGKAGQHACIPFRHPDPKESGELRNEMTPQAAVLLDVFNRCTLAPNAIRQPSLPFRTLSC
ncbi:hypothetical protein [Bacillus sp. FJAT-28004]|uniref:hypothetical protein n=1 Tax=Bacillus sp. FJAT-28004 TaxID=1679165 RepID=UPI0006B46577|nr:hypothetical protein [Bacillus sp. FJAT-28004]